MSEYDQAKLNSKTGSVLNIDMDLRDATKGDLVVYTQSDSKDLAQTIHISEGGANPIVYKALQHFRDVMQDRYRSLDSELIRLQSENGKAIIVDSNAKERLLSLEAKDGAWVIKSFTVFGEFGSEISFSKTDLSPAKNRAFAVLLGAMKQEQNVAVELFDDVVGNEAQQSLKASSEQDTDASFQDSSTQQAWQRFLAMKDELAQLTARPR